MLTLRRCAAATMLAILALMGCGCGGSAVATPSAATSQAPATPSVGSAGGGMAGFLAAARNQDESQVPVWLATSADITDLNELLRVYSGFGSSGGVFWEVRGVTVTSTASTGAGRADVTLSGDIVWCLGAAPSDPTATCSVVTPVAGQPHTYRAAQVDGRWKADIDINASSGLDHNPLASPTAGSATSTPAAT